MKRKKINPQRVPVTAADVKRAKERATNDAIKHALYMVLYILVDKHDAPKEDVQQLAREIDWLSRCIASGAIRWEDIRQVLEDEYEIEVNLR